MKNAIGYLIEQIIRGWINITGRTVDFESDFWLDSPMAEANYVGSEFYNHLAEKRNLTIETSPTAGLLEDFNILSNDDFDASIYPFFKQKKFHYLEHGIGNFINSIEISTKRKLFYFFLRLLFFIKLSNYYPIKYQNYFSILSNKKIKFQYVNGFKTKSINLSNFQNILEFISKKIKLKKIKNKKKNILLNFSNFEENTPLIEIKKVIDKILKKSNKKKYNYIIKDHTRREPHKKNKKFVMSILKKENVSVVTLTNKIPAELVAKYYDCKKMFSLQSSLPYHYSKIDKNCDINIFFNISMKYPSKNVWFVGKVNLFSINWYKNYFNNINFF